MSAPDISHWGTVCSPDAPVARRSGTGLAVGAVSSDTATAHQVWTTSSPVQAGRDLRLHHRRHQDGEQLRPAPPQRPAPQQPHRDEHRHQADEAHEDEGAGDPGSSSTSNTDHTDP